MWIWHFNSRPSARGDAITVAPAMMMLPFQFTPLREGRPVAAVVDALSVLFQFTPLREGRRCHLRALFKPQSISIHAPPRGATVVHRELIAEQQADFNSRPSARGDPVSSSFVSGAIFQFTPLREGRRKVRCAPGERMDFNSRPSARGDNCHVSRTKRHIISIHAPPRGATAEALL